MKPKISVIIALSPNRNIEVIDSLKKSTFRDFEVIVEKGLNPSENRNEGVKKAKADIIAFIDDDAVVEKNLLKNAYDFLQKNKDVAVAGGPQLTPEDDKFFARISGLVMTSFLATYKMSSRYKRGKLNFNADELSLTSANLFIRKEIFNELKGFNTSLYPGEDPELLDRIKKAGHKIAYNPELIIYHRRRSTFSSFLQQFFLYGSVRLKKEKAAKSLINPVFFMPSLFILYIILMPFILFPISLIPFLFYILLILLNSLYLAIRNMEFLGFFIMPFLFFSVHISYGLGLISSLFRK